MSEVVIDMIGGNCPVQAEGMVCGKKFYFRARGGQWRMNIGGDDVVGEPEWSYAEDYGDNPYAAGWMTEKEARTFIQFAAMKYTEANRGGIDELG